MLASSAFKSTNFSSHSPKSSSSPTNHSQFKKKKNRKIELAQSRADENTLEEVQISPLRKTKVVMQFQYYPEYLMKDSYLIINENNLKAFGRVTDLCYDTISKLYSNGTDSKKKRKSSLPPQAFTALIGAAEESKSTEDAYESPTRKKSTRTRRTKQSHSMCITELQEENKQ